jgi:NAD(P)-dependent dehydrogenase (short-subunit alcohol dehydrogenase family)
MPTPSWVITPTYLEPVTSSGANAFAHRNTPIWANAQNSIHRTITSLSDDALLAALAVAEGVPAPDLPRAKVTPRAMIKQAVGEVAAETKNLYVLHAEVGVRDNLPGTDEVVKRMIERQIGPAVMSAMTFTTEGNWLENKVRGEVVVMKPDDLRKIIEAVGERVLKKAIENGFIR